MKQSAPRTSVWRMSLALLALALGNLAFPVAAAAASQGFYEQDNAHHQAGTLMSSTANAGVVEAASDKNAANLVGVISTDDAALDLQQGQTNVKTDGVGNVLVSTINGDIRVGDRIAPSPIVGIGAKLSGSGWIIGIAQASLDKGTKGVVNSEVSDSSGKKHQVSIAAVPVSIKITYFGVSSSNNSSSNSSIPTAIQNLADNLAGKHVRPLVLVLSFILLLSGVVFSTVMVNSAVRGGMLAISRQPLSKRIINTKMLQSISIALAILFATFAVTYAILHFF